MIDTIVSCITLLKDLLLARKSEQKEKVEKNRSAIIAVQKAALGTRGYLARFENEPASVGYSEESTLSQLWFEAYSRCLKAEQHDLAHCCEIKAHGWVDAKIWQDPRYSGIEVSLDSIVDTCRQLTGGSPGNDA